MTAFRSMSVCGPPRSRGLFQPAELRRIQGYRRASFDNLDLLATAMPADRQVEAAGWRQTGTRARF
ncbi:MAG: hypothetical protein KGI75_17945 [Rhizobiaceae bacterium]|nr:hypothetical protein [Rhizobiaceae bacterium]